MKECPFCRHCFPDQFNNCPSDGGALASSIPGDTVLDNRYQLERRLGQGGMGIVFKARHIFLKTSYAIKVILPDLVGNDPMLATRFRQEAMVAARIDHRNIVSVTDFGVVDGKMPYLVMDFIKGRSLHDLLGEEGRLAPGPALEIMTALCAGVGAAHRQGIVHRDLKPLNVMLQENMPISDAVKVLDFGLAKIKSGELLGSFVAAQTTGLMGSPYYMAPEQWSDEEPDSRADIYSLGVILFQMLAGEVPFKGPTLPSIMNKHINELPPSLITLGVNVPDNLEAVIRRAMAKKRDNRMSSVEEFISEFRMALDSYDSAFARTSTEMTRDSQLMTMPFPKTGDHGSVTAETTGPQPWVDKSDSQQRIEDEADRLKREFEEAQRRADEARERAEEAARKRAEEDAARRKAEEEAARKLAEEEAARQRAEEEARKREEEAAARKREEEEAARMLAEEEARQRAEAEEARRRSAEEAARLAREIVEAQQRAEDARQRAEEEARKRTEEAVARKRAEEEAHRLALEVSEAQQRAAEARLRAEEEARIRASEEQERKRVEEELERKRIEESLRIHAEGEVARKQALEEADRLAREVAEAQRRADEARTRAEEEARRRAEAESALQRAEQEARKLAQQVSDAQRRAEESRRRSEEEAARRAELEEEERANARARQEQLDQMAQLSQRSEPPAPGLSGAGGSAGGFQQSAGRQSLAEHTLVHQGSQQFVHSEKSWPSVPPFPVSSPQIEPAKKSYTVPIVVSVVILLLVVLVGGGGALYWTKWFGPKATPNQPDVAPTTKPTTQEPPPANPSAPDMVKIDGGSFRMGLSEVPTKSSYDLAQYPERPVNVKTFWMDKTEVTNAAYADFVREAHYPAPSYWTGGKPPAGQEQWPVTNVSVADANAYAQWRSKRDNTKYQLPTEEQWEYAARNGSERTLYPWGNDWLDDHANVDANSLKPVGSFPKGASKLGVLDLIGNAWEWTSSRAAPYPGNTLLVIPPGQVIIRGGAYVEASKGPDAITAARRSWVLPTDKQAAIGFRLVHE